MNDTERSLSSPTDSTRRFFSFGRSEATARSSKTGASRAVRWMGRAAAFALIAALGSLSTPASVQAAEVELLSAEMTVALLRGTTDAGYDRSRNQGALTDHTFSYGGINYAIDSLYFDPDNGRLILVTDTLSSDLVDEFTLTLGDKSFAGSAATILSVSGGTTWYGWSNAGLSWSVGDTVSVKLLVPGAPEKLTGFGATAGAGAVTLAWTDPSDTSISKYQYQQKEGTGSFSSWMNIPGSGAGTTSYTVPNLTPGTAYTFKIRAVGSGGDGAESDEASATPVQAIRDVYFESSRSCCKNTYFLNNDIEVTIEVNGEVTVVSGTPQLALTIGSHTRQADFYDSGMATFRGTRYTALFFYYTVQADDFDDNGVSVGTGAFSLNGATLRNADGNDITLTIPGNLAITDDDDHLVDGNSAPSFTEGDSTTRSVAENTAAATDIGTAVAATDADAANTLTYSLGGTDAASFDIDTGTGQLKTKVALDHETKPSYDVTVAVADGQGGSDSITVTIAVTDDDTEAPGTPAAPTVTGESSGSVAVAWTAPDNAGPAITDYDLRHREGTSGAFTDFAHAGDATSATITGLNPGTSYEVQVRATNDEGTGPWSASGTRSTSAAAPTVLTATGAADGVALSWTAPARTATVTGYQYRQSTDGGNSWNPDWTDIAGSSATTASHTVTGLTDGDTYTFEVRATNNNGTADAADDIHGAAARVSGIAGAPNPPTNLITNDPGGASGSPVRIDFDWVGPTSGPAVTGYQYRY